ncbi:hypothetical protein WN093_01925 [Gammaproteobacteria bacterium AS21]
MPVILISCLLLTACASSVNTAGKVAQVIYNPDIQVGPNEVQLSKVSLAALSDDVVTTLSAVKRGGIFGSKVPANYYLLSLYELDQTYFKKARNGILSANDALDVIDGEYLAKHQYYLKLNGYRFIKHFSVDENVKGLFGVVNYQQPKCVVWSSVQPIKNIGEEYNLYLQGQGQAFTLRSEKDITAPGEPLKIDNRFFGQCGNQANAVAASVDNPMSKLVESYLQAPATSLKQNQVVGKKSVSILDNVDSLAKAPSIEVQQPEVLSSTTIVEDYQYPIKNSSASPASKAVVSDAKAAVAAVAAVTEVTEVTEVAQPEVLSNTTIVEDYQYPIKNSSTSPVSKAAKTPAKAVAVAQPEVLSNTTIVEDYQRPISSAESQSVVENNKAAAYIKASHVEKTQSTNTQLDSHIQKTHAAKINEHGHRIFLVTGLGYIKTKGNALVVRIQPDGGSQKLSIIGNGTSLQVQRYSPANNGWLYIESEAVKSGWVRASFVNWYLM